MEASQSYSGVWNLLAFKFWTELINKFYPRILVNHPLKIVVTQQLEDQDKVVFIQFLCM
jgi:hypothetical protein